MRDPYGQPPTAWQQAKRGYRVFDYLTDALFGPPLIVAGFVCLFVAHGDGFTLGMGGAFLIGGGIMIYGTLKKLGWIGR